MTSRAVKLRRQMARGANHWTIEDLKTLYVGHGFIWEERTGHSFVRHPEYPDLYDTVPRARQVLPVYIRRALRLIDDAESRSGVGK